MNYLNRPTSFALGVWVLAAIAGAGAAGPVNADVGISANPVNMTTSFPRGVRNIGMGVTGVTDLSRTSTGHFNPASVAWADVLAITHSRNDWPPDYHHDDTRVVSPARWSDEPWREGFRVGMLASYTTASYDDPRAAQAVFLPSGTGATFNGRDYYVSAGAAVAYKRGAYEVGVGAAAKYTDSNIGIDYTSWNFDAGVIAAVEARGANGAGMRPRVGAALLNVGSELFDAVPGGTVESPTENRVGVGVDLYSPRADGLSRRLGRDVSVATMSLNLDFIDGNDERLFESGWSWGVEVAVADFVFLRGGRTENGIGVADFNTYGAGVGMDLGRMFFRASWAYTQIDDDVYIFFRDAGEENFFGITVGGRL